MKLLFEMRTDALSQTCANPRTEYSFAQEVPITDADCVRQCREFEPWQIPQKELEILLRRSTTPTHLLCNLLQRLDCMLVYLAQTVNRRLDGSRDNVVNPFEES